MKRLEITSETLRKKLKNNLNKDKYLFMESRTVLKTILDEDIRIKNLEDRIDELKESIPLNSFYNCGGIKDEYDNRTSSLVLKVRLIEYNYKLHIRYYTISKIDNDELLTESLQKLSKLSKKHLKIIYGKNFKDVEIDIYGNRFINKKTGEELKTSIITIESNTGESICKSLVMIDDSLCNYEINSKHIAYTTLLALNYPSEFLDYVDKLSGLIEIEKEEMFNISICKEIDRLNSEISKYHNGNFDLSLNIFVQTDDRNEHIILDDEVYNFTNGIIKHRNIMLKKEDLSFKKGILSKIDLLNFQLPGIYKTDRLTIGDWIMINKPTEYYIQDSNNNIEYFMISTTTPRKCLWFVSETKNKKVLKTYTDINRTDKFELMKHHLLSKNVYEHIDTLIKTSKKIIKLDSVDRTLYNNDNIQFIDEGTFLDILDYRERRISSKMIELFESL